MRRKGAGKTLYTIIVVVGSIAFVSVLLAIVSGLLAKTGSGRKERKLEGGKFIVLNDLKRLVHKCWDNNKNLERAKICFEIQLNLTEKINASEVEGSVTSGDLKPGNIEVPQNLTKKTENVIVKYEKNLVSIEER